MATYKSDPRGLSELGRSTGMGDAMVAATEAGHRWAEDQAPSWARTGDGAFHVERVTVQAGHRNENRAGAALVNEVDSAFPGRGSVLLRAVNVIEGAGS